MISHAPLWAARPIEEANPVPNMLVPNLLEPREIEVLTTMSAPPVSELPTAPQLLCAFQGRRLAGGELLRLAYALVLEHQRRVRVRDFALAAEIDFRRSELIADINGWVSQELPRHRHGAVLHTESLGSVIDRMARSWVEANHTIDSAGVRSDATHKHWYRLAELVDGYTDLIAEVSGGRRRLPEL